MITAIKLIIISFNFKNKKERILKKLIVSEMASIILVLGVFLLVFTLLNGWEKAGQERYTAAFVAVVVAVVIAAVAVVAVAVVLLAVGGAATVATVAAVIIATGAAVAGGGGAAVVAVIVVIAAVAVVAVVALVAVIAEESEKINISKKAIRLSMGAEAAAIILPIILITFC